MNRVKSIAVLGSGTAGLITAIILKKRLSIGVDVIHSENIGIVGVGEGSTEHFKDFMQFAGINQYDIIRECNATYKSGIMFQGWGKKDYLHSVNEPFDEKFAQYSFVYAKQIAENSNYVNYKMYWKNEFNRWFLGKENEFPSNQFHFDTYKLNDFLIKFAKKLGIKFYNDQIQDVRLNDQGQIKKILGKKDSYSADFYIDATGFSRVLMNKLGAKWNSYSKYLKMNSAITFQTEDEENYNYWTLAKAMDYGWMFKIPVWGRHGNGYIFSDEFTNYEKAKLEVEKYLGKSINVGKTFKFDPGTLEDVWIKNCVAVGLSASFVEPLEATSIGTTIQQAFLLMHRLTNYDQHVIKKYNSEFQTIMNNIRDFICLHYITDKDNNNFWNEIKKIEKPDSLNENLNIWKHRLPIKEDFSNCSNYRLFDADNFILVMHGLGLIDKKSIEEEYKSYNPYVHELADFIINDRLKFEKNVDRIKHKDFILQIRTT